MVCAGICIVVRSRLLFVIGGIIAAEMSMVLDAAKNSLKISAFSKLSDVGFQFVCLTLEQN